MHVATVTTVTAAGYWVLAPKLDAVHEVGPMESAAVVAEGDRVLIAARADTGGWVIVATMPPA